jgi:hypothetical protein
MPGRCLVCRHYCNSAPPMQLMFDADAALPVALAPLIVLIRDGKMAQLSVICFAIAYRLMLVKFFHAA